MIFDIMYGVIYVVIFIATLDCVSTWMGDCLGAGIICSFHHSSLSWAKVAHEHHFLIGPNYK